MRKETELTDITDKIYDTLMGNVGMSPAHESFDTLPLVEQECYAEKGTITFWFENGNVYQVKIEKIADSLKDSGDYTDCESCPTRITWEEYRNHSGL